MAPAIASRRHQARVPYLPFQHKTMHHAHVHSKTTLTAASAAAPHAMQGPLAAAATAGTGGPCCRQCRVGRRGSRPPAPAWTCPRGVGDEAGGAITNRQAQPAGTPARQIPSPTASAQLTSVRRRPSPATLHARAPLAPDPLQLALQGCRQPGKWTDLPRRGRTARQPLRAAPEPPSAAAPPEPMQAAALRRWRTHPPGGPPVRPGSGPAGPALPPARRPGAAAPRRRLPCGPAGGRGSSRHE